MGVTLGVSAFGIVAASSAQAQTAVTAPPSARTAPTKPPATSNAPARPKLVSTPYTMTPADLALDCGKLTGRIQVRIRQLRGAMSDPQTSGLSRGIQAMTSPIIGGTTYGIQPTADVARDVGVLQAFNARLREKSCPAFDLEADLAPGNTAPARPIRPAKPAAPARP